MTNTAPSISTTTLSEWRRPVPALNGRSLLQQLFNRLDGSYPGRFKTMFPDTVSIKNWEDAWEDALIRENISPREVAVGLARIGGDWPPSLPEFLTLCRPALEPESAFREAVQGVYARKQGEMGQWSHPAIYWTSVAVGQHELMQASWQAMRVRWERVLRDVFAKGAWDPIPDPAPALPAPGSTVSTRQEAHAQIKRLGIDKGMLKPKGNPTAWVDKVLSNPKKYCAFSVAAAQKMKGGAAA